MGDGSGTISLLVGGILGAVLGTFPLQDGEWLGDIFFASWGVVWGISLQNGGLLGAKLGAKI